MAALEPHGFTLEDVAKNAIEPAQTARKRVHIGSSTDADALQEPPGQDDRKQKAVCIAAPLDEKTGVGQFSAELITAVPVLNLEVVIVKSAAPHERWYPDEQMSLRLQNAIHFAER